MSKYPVASPATRLEATGKNSHFTHLSRNPLTSLSPSCEMARVENEEAGSHSVASDYSDTSLALMRAKAWRAKTFPMGKADGSGWLSPVLFLEALSTLATGTSSATLHRGYHATGVW